MIPNGISSKYAFFAVAAVAIMASSFCGVGISRMAGVPMTTPSCSMSHTFTVPAPLSGNKAIFLLISVFLAVVAATNIKKERKLSFESGGASANHIFSEVHRPQFFAQLFSQGILNPKLFGVAAIRP